MRISKRSYAWSGRPRRLAGAVVAFVSIAAMMATTAPSANGSPPSVTLAAAGTPAKAAPAAGLYRMDPELGVQWHGMWAYYTDQQRETVLGQLVQSNLHLVRMDVSWAMLQPSNRQTYDPWGVAF